MEERIEFLLRKSITDIARKCGVRNIDVIETFKKLIQNED